MFREFVGAALEHAGLAKPVAPGATANGAKAAAPTSSQ
jgi:hypothetical protein